MPRIHDALLECVVYLYPSKADAERGTRVGGTGFIIGIPTTVFPDYWHGYVVTNAHVIIKAPVIRLNTKDGK